MDAGQGRQCFPGAPAHRDEGVAALVLEGDRWSRDFGPMTWGHATGSSDRITAGGERWATRGVEIAEQDRDDLALFPT